MKIVCIEFENLKNFKDGSLRIDFFATDRVFQDSELYQISSGIYSQNLIGFIGLNATGKTTTLRLTKFALDIVINNKNLNDPDTPEMISDDTILRVTFFHNNAYYQLESIIGLINDGSIVNEHQFYYKEEFLRVRDFRLKNRKDLTNFSDNKTRLIRKRSDLGSEVKNYLDDGKSIINPEIKYNHSCVVGNLWQSYLNLPLLSEKVPSEILEVFDDNISTLSFNKFKKSEVSIKWTLAFKNDPNRSYMSPDLLDLNRLISTGTIKGQGIVQQIIYVLKKGGYLVVDELEMHLNKELVRMIIGFFKSRITNPHGACLIFTTHYPEILDSINRKDNIYITRKIEHKMSVTKFSNEFSRNDFKKSEIIISNALKGTAPKYESIKRLRDYICQSI